MMALMEVFCGGWAAFHRDWWARRDDPNVLILFYDEAVKDLQSTVARVSNFMGKEQDAATLARVVERTSFDYMKKRSKNFDPPGGLVMMPFQKPKDGDIMTNKGKNGDGKKNLTDALQARIRRHCQEVLSSTDFPLEKLPS